LENPINLEISQEETAPDDVGRDSEKPPDHGGITIRW
jgi:hypothetical protein